MRLIGRLDERPDLVDLEERLLLLRHLETADLIDGVTVDVAVSHGSGEYLAEQRQGLVDRDVAQPAVAPSLSELPTHRCQPLGAGGQLRLEPRDPAPPRRGAR